MRDLVHYGLGFGPFGAIAHAVFVRAKLKMIFELPEGNAGPALWGAVSRRRFKSFI